MEPNLILTNGKFTTLDRANPVAGAIAVADGRFATVGWGGGVPASDARAFWGALGCSCWAV